MEIAAVGSYRAQWGEGPIWWEGALYYVDIEGRRVLRFAPETGEERGQRVGTVVPRLKGGLVIAGDGGFAFLDEESGAVSKIADPEAEKGGNRFNDGKCSPEGRFFAGTISTVKKTGDAALWRLDVDGSVSMAFDGGGGERLAGWNDDRCGGEPVDRVLSRIVRGVF